MVPGISNMTDAIRPPSAVLFDLDGTLVDTIPDLADAVNRILDEINVPNREAAELRTWLGNGVEPLLHRAITGELHGQADTSQVAAALAIFEDHYDHCNGQRSEVYHGVVEALTHFQDAGVPLACVTNKPAFHTHKLLERTELAKFFAAVVGGDTLPVRKPDPGPIYHAARQLPGNPQAGPSLLFVGDSITDIRAGHNAGCSVIAVSYGYNHGADIRSSDPAADAVIDCFTELISAWERLAK
jgi:phosphoglycolate phosphatase